MMNLGERASIPGYFNDGVRQIDLILVYTQKSRNINNRSYRSYFLQKLKILGIEMETHRSLLTDPPTFFVRLHATWRFLIRTADLLKMPMPIEEIGAEAVETFQNCSKCFQPAKTCPAKFHDAVRIPFHTNYLGHFLNHERQDEFFTSAQRTRMVEYEVTRTRVEMKEKDRRKTLDVQTEEGGKVKRYVTFSWLLHNHVFVPYMIPHDSDLTSASKEREENSATGRKKGTFKAKKPEKHPPKSKFSACCGRKGDKVEDVGAKAKESKKSKLPKIDRERKPNQIYRTRRWLYDNWVSLRALLKLQPLDPIYSYFGSEVAYYFAFLQFYTLALLIPAIMGAMAFIYGTFYAANLSYRVDAFCRSMTESYFCRRCTTVLCNYSQFRSYCLPAWVTSFFDNLASPAYSFLLSLWAVWFLERWSQKQADLAQKWGTASKDGRADETTRVEYLFGAKGRRKNPATLKEEPYVPKSQKRRQYLISYATVFFFLTLVFSTMAGIIIYRIVFSQIKNILAGTSLRGYISPSVSASITASVLNVLAISIMSLIYPRVARRLTEMEFPRTDTQFNRSYTYKVALFQFVNYYGTMFYLAFVAGYPILPPFKLSRWTKTCEPQGCMLEVSVQLVVVLTIKQILQNITELSVPLAKNFWRQYKIRSNRTDTDEETAHQIEKDFLLVPPPQPTAFNDYLELVIQYGFIVMFSPAFPPAPIFALLNNIFEVRLDAYKFTVEYRRPLPRNVVSIGPWLDIMAVFTKISVVVNAALICFTGFALDEIHYYASINGGIRSFVEHTYSLFNTSDYERLFSSANMTNVTLADTIYELTYDPYTNTTVDQCWYFGKFYPPGIRKEYKPTEYGIRVYIWKVAFMILFQNLINFLRIIIGAVVPVRTRTSRERQAREAYLEQDVEAKERAKRLRERERRREERLAQQVAKNGGANNVNRN